MVKVALWHDIFSMPSLNIGAWQKGVYLFLLFLQWVLLVLLVLFGCFIWMAQKGQEGSKKFFVWLRMQSTIYNSSEGGERSTSYPLPLSASSSYLASLMLQLYPNISEFDHIYFIKIPWKYSGLYQIVVWIDSADSNLKDIPILTGPRKIQKVQMLYHPHIVHYIVGSLYQSLIMQYWVFVESVVILRLTSLKCLVIEIWQS